MHWTRIGDVIVGRGATLIARRDGGKIKLQIDPVLDVDLIYEEGADSLWSYLVRHSNSLDREPDDDEIGQAAFRAALEDFIIRPADAACDVRLADDLQLRDTIHKEVDRLRDLGTDEAARLADLMEAYAEKIGMRDGHVIDPEERYTVTEGQSDDHAIH